MKPSERIQELAMEHAETLGGGMLHATVTAWDVARYLDEQEQASRAAKGEREGYAHHTPGCEFDQSHGLDCTCFEPKTIEAFYDAMESMTMHCLDKEPHLFRVDNEITIRFGDERAKTEQHGGGRADDSPRPRADPRPRDGYGNDPEAYRSGTEKLTPAEFVAIHKDAFDEGWNGAVSVLEPSKSPAPDAGGGEEKERTVHINPADYAELEKVGVVPPVCRCRRCGEVYAQYVGEKWQMIGHCKCAELEAKLKDSAEALGRAEAERDKLKELYDSNIREWSRAAT